MLYLALIGTLLLILGLALVSRFFTRTAILTLEDMIAHPGEKAELVAQLERGVFLFVDPPLRGEKIEFRSEKGVLGVAETDEKGTARWPTTELQPGLNRFHARLVDSRFRAAEPEALVAMWPPDEPVLITDIDHTIADVTGFQFLFTSDEKINPIPGAPETLKELSTEMRILYFSARDHIFLNRTRRWLRSRGFPEGILLQRRVRFTKATPQQHKMMRLDEVGPKLKRVHFGVGDLGGDVLAYATHGIRPIYFGPNPAPAGLPPETIHAKTWAEVREVVLGELKS